MKRLPIDIRTFSVRDIGEASGADTRMVDAFRANPFSESDDSIAKISGYVNGNEAGHEFVFPLRLRMPAGEVDVLAGSSLYVNPLYRRSGLGMDLPELRWQKSPSKIALGASLSQMALPVHQLLDYIIFLMPRNIMLWCSRALVETKLKGVAAKCVTFALDCGIFLYSLLLKVTCSSKLNGLTFEEVSSEDASMLGTVAELISEDSAPFSEVHNVQWLRWHLTESFSKDGPMRLFVARAKGEVVGYYMTKMRYHEQASHRGFKNVWLGSVVEWQVKKGYEQKLGWLLASAALRLKKEGMDAVEIPSADKSLNHFLCRIGWRQVGESNFVIKAGEGAPLFGDEEMAKIENWRLRPAMGDAGLS